MPVAPTSLDLPLRVDGDGVIHVAESTRRINAAAMDVALQRARDPQSAVDASRLLLNERQPFLRLARC
jgi:hypothetical protein